MEYDIVNVKTSAILATTGTITFKCPTDNGLGCHGFVENKHVIYSKSIDGGFKNTYMMIFDDGTYKTILQTGAGSQATGSTEPLMDNVNRQIVLIDMNFTSINIFR